MDNNKKRIQLQKDENCIFYIIYREIQQHKDHQPKVSMGVFAQFSMENTKMTKIKDD